MNMSLRPVRGRISAVQFVWTRLLYFGSMSSWTTKFDVNINPRPLGFPFPEENNNYIEADWTQREKVFRHHRNLVLGLLYFVQNDPEIPEAHRRIANQYHLPKD